MTHTNEIPVAGRTTGLIEGGEFVEWEATHLFVRQRLASKITRMVNPQYFIDEMITGAFKSFSHKHEIRVIDDSKVLMIDDFSYELPLGALGHIAYILFLRRYMENLIEARSRRIKAALESDEWKTYLAH
jgi:ligand-binding SRPBCC domain-containing protein